MYTSSNFESDLINSYAWTTAIVFIQEFSGDTNYSMEAGRNTATTNQKSGESILDSSYVDEGDIAQDVRCNIYDMAGNVREWSTETLLMAALPCTARGGNWLNTKDCPSSRFNHTTTGNSDEFSARPILYL